MKARMQRGMTGDGDMSIAAVIVRSVLWIAWPAIRLPLFSLLLIFEPIVRCVLS